MQPQPQPGGWLHSVWRNLFPPRTANVAPVPVVPLPPPPWPNSPEQFRARASVDHFAFSVTLLYNWDADTVNRQGWARILQPMAREQIQELVRAMAGAIAPHRPDALEDKANERLAEMREYRYDDVRIRYRPQVFVAADDRVRPHLEAYWERQVALHCMHDLDRLRADLADDLVARWSTTLRELLTDPLTRHAGKLVEKELFAGTKDGGAAGSGRKDFATVVAELFDGQAREGRELVSLLRTAIRDHENIGIGHHEFVQTYDEALRRLQPPQPVGPNLNGRDSAT